MKPSKGNSIDKCSGSRRYGGAFSFGPVTWVDCPEKPTVMIRIKHPNGKFENCPACNTCWKEAIENKMKIVKVEPIAQEEINATINN